MWSLIFIQHHTSSAKVFIRLKVVVMSTNRKGDTSKWLVHNKTANWREMVPEQALSPEPYPQEWTRDHTGYPNVIIHCNNQANRTQSSPQLLQHGRDHPPKANSWYQKYLLNRNKNNNLHLRQLWKTQLTMKLQTKCSNQQDYTIKSRYKMKLRLYCKLILLTTS